VLRLSRRPTGLQLNDVLPDDMLLRLSDSNLVTLAGVIFVSLQQVDSSTCASFGPGGGDFDPNIMTLATYVDSATAERWMYLMHQMMLTGLRQLPRGPVISLDSALRIVQGIVEDLSPEERARLRTATTSPKPSLAARCWGAQHFFRRVMNMAPGQAGPMMRTLMGPNLAK
jgi:hypothetical protein